MQKEEEIKYKALTPVFRFVQMKLLKKCNMLTDRITFILATVLYLLFNNRKKYVKLFYATFKCKIYTSYTILKLPTLFI